MRYLILVVFFALFACKEDPITKENPNPYPDSYFLVGEYDDYDYHQKFDPPLGLGPKTEGRFVGLDRFKAYVRFDLDQDSIDDFEVYNLIRFVGNLDSVVYEELTFENLDNHSNAAAFFIGYGWIRDSVYQCRDTLTNFSVTYNRSSAYQCQFHVDSLLYEYNYYDVLKTHQKGDTIPIGGKDRLLGPACWLKRSEDHGDTLQLRLTTFPSFTSSPTDTFYIVGTSFDFEDQERSRLFWLKMGLQGERSNKRYVFYEMAYKAYNRM
ncbi:hypothetical protein [Croceimicrobium hydrocarbonivorans]|uniref:Lipoprotein n=1 Tax=Croceimicrobium hydrocarbonivorans TaxID=2761580 RepID=A0A7H0VAL9_9FLAO|nr:hypothetical protein [Croceimicrobium hydrocarbonivorans]QNR22767.1 hypothetical protein H4K34_10275 [Croceimicrobium hydrocarbonivorans]